jgi:hypothetical protein
MSFTLDDYARLRPYLYHVTARENLARLRRTRRLDPAATIIEQASRLDLKRSRRPEAIVVSLNGDFITLKDQRPLIAANVALKAPWQFGDFVEYLNSHVFFWPGDALTPLVSGQRLLAHYASELPLIIRVPFLSLLANNPDREPLFSPFNSGAPRMQRGKPVERGPDLFRPANRCPRRPHEVIEVAFRSSVLLPDDTSIAGEPETWTALNLAT